MGRDILTMGESPSKKHGQLLKALKGRYIITPFQGFDYMSVFFLDGLSPTVNKFRPIRGFLTQYSHYKK
jgi:hypothetical protein